MNIRNLAIVACLIVIVSVGGFAITNGQPDGTRHPYVGRFGGTFCTGVAISPTVVITAAHCADTPGLRAKITFNPGPAAPPPSEAFAGTFYPHPDWCMQCEHGLSRFDTHDIAVFVLDNPVTLSEYAVLPEVGLADLLPMKTRLTVVGYGVRGYITGNGNPLDNPDLNPRTRYFAETELIQSEYLQRDEYLKLTANPSQDKGGTCFGDSGGPALLGNIVVGITSYLANAPCAGVTYSNRIDLQYALEFIKSH